MRALAITCVKNEGAFLLDWLAHHRACGFDDFLVFSNDCDDGTDAMLDRLQAMGWLTHVPNPGPHPRGPQWEALALADRHALRAAADWVMVLDVDEYVNIHLGARRLPDLLQALPDADAIAMTWRFFGNDGVVAYADRPVVQQFLRAAPSRLAWPWRASMIKTLFRNDGCYRKLGVHRPRDPDPARLAGLRWVDGSGRALPPAFATQRLFTDPGADCHAMVQLNHYALGAMESFVVKCDRGRANRSAGDFDMGYWIDRNFCAVEDRSVLGLDSAGLRAELAGDGLLAALHAQAVAWRQARFAALMQQEAWRAFFGRLLLAPPSRVLDPGLVARLLHPARISSPDAQQ